MQKNIAEKTYTKKSNLTLTKTLIKAVLSFFAGNDFKSISKDSTIEEGLT